MTTTLWHPSVPADVTTTLWHPSVPADVRNMVEPHLNRWSTLVPSWCHYLKVFWDERDSTDQAKATPRMEYREADLCICPPWLGISDMEREDTIIHELLHLQLEPMQNVTTDILNTLKKKAPEAHRYADEQVRYARESTVSDLLHAVRELRA